MSSFLQRARGQGRLADGEGGQGQQALENGQMSATSDASAGQAYARRPRDRNAPDHRLQFNSKCIYERALPGGAYITCHVDRLQRGYYDSAQIHEDCIDNVRFVALHFVFHAASTANRFKKAVIAVSTRKGEDRTGRLSSQRRLSHSDAGELKRQRVHPSIIRHAPHVLYGSISPESLQWNFNLAGSLGISQGPASANISPSGGYRGSYKVYEMMRIQGSSRTYRGYPGVEDDIEDGEVVWTLEENTLQRSGLPREFTFIVLLQKGDPDVETLFDIAIDPVVSSHLGAYPALFLNLPQYRPLAKAPLDLDREIGQTFEPVTDREHGYNFANLSCSFEDFVALPGTTYTSIDNPGSAGGAQMQTDTTKTPTANSLQNSITLGQARLPAAGALPHRAVYPVSGQAQQQQQPGATQAQQQQQPQRATSTVPPQHVRSASVQPPPPPSWQYPQYPSLFPDSTLNVRVVVERAPSPSSPLSQLKDVSARRPHSLRRSRSRTGLEKEFGDTRLDEAQSAAQRYMAERTERRLSAGAMPMRRPSVTTGGAATTPMRPRNYADKLRDKELGAGAGAGAGAGGAAGGAAGGLGGGGVGSSPLSPMRERTAYERLGLAKAPGARMSYPTPRNVSS